METNLFNRLQATLLAVATVGLVLLAVWNFRQESQFQQPDDGVWWAESATGNGLIAQRVLANSPGKRAGIEAGDLLTAVNDEPVVHQSDLERELYSTGVYGKANYSITRDGIRLDTPVPVIPVPPDRSVQQALRLIGLIYLAIGLYVLLRRWTAPRATHFYVFCLVSFALNALKYTGKWDLLDQTVFWGNVMAESLQPALFLHFALCFPQERFKTISRRWLLPLVYAPGIGLLGLWITAITRWEATGVLKHRLDQAGIAYYAAFYVIAAALFMHSYRRADTPLLRQQLKWLTRGTLLAVLPFTLLNAIPFLMDWPMPSLLTKLAGLSLVFVPLTFSWAIVRYRLMDTDLIFKRGVAYTLATGLILGAYFGIIAAIAEMVHAGMPEAMRQSALVIAILVTAAVFDPLKRRIQGWVDRIFDRHRYDYRRALVAFGRGLSFETDLKALLNSIVEQLPRTLLVARVAVFLTQESGGLRLAASHGLPPEALAAQDQLALGFIDFDRAKDHSHIF
ncbi:MAG TPA: PDZ domain-containing protein, partial [Terracidiphilus sp.]|nr:PDZ domain-containing protein [Terracidiphilus sp.]